MNNEGDRRNPPAKDEARATAPFGLGNAYGFAILNGLSSQIVLSSPIILYGRQLGASATVLGILAGMMPLLVIFQMPAAQYVPRVGYKRFMMNGWSARVLFIFVLAAIPLTAGFLDANTRLTLVLAVLFFFNLLRGISSCAWLPWITELVPSSLRGQYLTREQFCVNFAGIGAFALAASLLGDGGTEMRFALVFLFSAVVGAISLSFLKRVPDVTIPHAEATARGPVPWKELAAYPPFRRILWLNLAWAVAYGGLPTFIVAFLRSHAGLKDGAILWAMIAFFVGGTVSTWVAGNRLDRLGSKPAVILTLLLGIGLSVGWMLQSAGVVETTLVRTTALLGVLGLANAVFLAATNRLAMLTAPKVGRSHFFALFSVVLNLALGLAPVGWGLLIDAVGTRRGYAFGLEWNQYGAFFGLAAIGFGIALVAAGRLEEKAASVESLLQELLLDDPKRALSRLFIRD